MDAKTFGVKLKEIRKEKGLTLLDLKDRTGYSDSYLSQIENGKKGMPNPDLLRKLAVGLDVSFIHLKNLAGYSASYMDYELGYVDVSAETGQFDGVMESNKSRSRDVVVELPCTEVITTRSGEKTIKELSDDELRRRLFDLDELLNMDVALYYKNEYVSDDKRDKIKTILKLVLD